MVNLIPEVDKRLEEDSVSLDWGRSVASQYERSAVQARKPQLFTTPSKARNPSPIKEYYTTAGYSPKPRSRSYTSNKVEGIAPKTTTSAAKPSLPIFSASKPRMTVQDLERAKKPR